MKLSKNERKNYVIRSLAVYRKWKLLIPYFDKFVKYAFHGAVVALEVGGTIFRINTKLIEKGLFHALMDTLSNLKIYLETLEEELKKPENQKLFKETVTLFCLLMVYLMEPNKIVVVNKGRVLLKITHPICAKLDLFYKNGMLRICFQDPLHRHL